MKICKNSEQKNCKSNPLHSIKQSWESPHIWGGSWILSQVLLNDPVHMHTHLAGAFLMNWDPRDGRSSNTVFRECVSNNNCTTHSSILYIYCIPGNFRGRVIFAVGFIHEFNNAVKICFTSMHGYIADINRSAYFPQILHCTKVIFLTKNAKISLRKFKAE